MWKTLGIAAATMVVGLVIGAAAVAATGWKVFASGSDSGDYTSYASADASVIHPHALAVRVSANADVSWTITCDGKTRAQAGQIIAASVPAAKTCHLYGSAANEGGLIRVALLKR